MDLARRRFAVGEFALVAAPRSGRGAHKHGEGHLRCSQLARLGQGIAGACLVTSGGLPDLKRTRLSGSIGWNTCVILIEC